MSILNTQRLRKEFFFLYFILSILKQHILEHYIHFNLCEALRGRSNRKEEQLDTRYEEHISLAKDKWYRID